MTEDEPTERLEDLDHRLKRARADETASRTWKDTEKGASGAPLGLALRVGVELVSAVAVGLGIGWLLDRWLGTRPWFMLVFILLGGAAGVLNVYRYAKGFGYGAGYKQSEKSNQNHQNQRD